MTTSRERFEEVIGKKCKFSFRLNAGGNDPSKREYAYPNTQHAWEIWQAAYPAGQESMRKRAAVAAKETGRQCSSLWNEPGCWMHATDACGESIRALEIEK